jgi:iron(III) transport system ATP-binding protein
MDDTVILHLEGVSKFFSAKRSPVLDQVTVKLDQGELLALLGPSGCGKTTLLRLVAGFEQPQSGVISLAGRIVAGDGQWLPPEQRDVGMVFQDYALFPHLSVAKNVAFGLENRRQKRTQRLTPKQIKHRTAEAIALVGLDGLADRYPHQLSGGQQQRVALARALAPRPTLVLLDEPLSNLDVQVRSRLREEIRSILKATGTSAIFVTHDQEEALAIADQVAVMCQGRIEQMGTPETIYREPASRFVAEFVTQANFLPAQRKGQVWETEVGCFAASLDQAEVAPTGNLMIRQEDLRLEPDATASVVVRDRHFLGREHCYCLLTSSGQELHARTSLATVLPIGTRVQVSATPTALQFFPEGA